MIPCLISISFVAIPIASDARRNVAAKIRRLSTRFCAWTPSTAPRLPTSKLPKPKKTACPVKSARPGTKPPPPATKPQLDALSARIERAEDRARALSIESPESPLRELLTQSPNVLDDSVPDGTGESDNVVVRSAGRPSTFDFEPLPHWELGERLGILDFERAAKLRAAAFRSSKARARGSRARSCNSFWIARTRKATPRSFHRFSCRGRRCGQPGSSRSFPMRCLWIETRTCSMIPTAEVPLAALHGDEILSIAELPRNTRRTRRVFAKKRERPAKTRVG